MKKIFALTLGLVSAASLAHAQDSGGFRIGLKAGATYSNISGDDVERITGPNYEAELGSYKLGYNVGVGVTIPLSSDGFFSLAPELLYNRKGYEIQSEQRTNLPAGVSQIEIEQQRVLHYLDLPILAKINAGGLFFELGPQASFLFGSRNKQQTTTKFTNGEKDKVEDNGKFQDYTGVGARDEADKSDLSQFDISGVAGIGYMTDGGFSVNLRYARGFNSLIDTKDQDNEPKAFNNAFTFQVGYLIPTK
ncbi:porin family protein [Hymenobacter weizhouensis]|uniref:porin family protein n=1 Tax=Hymenobacter sp. YIM 151500-1 TaxID=2987689 RepID=UPI002226FE1C|nr:porin family protein [Hymenobacter sp. YIM 151500-1]UYZ61759.1 PorT family protein [Hymenobacter sp. YIM 151500-1]